MAAKLTNIATESEQSNRRVSDTTDASTVLAGHQGQLDQLTSLEGEVRALRSLEIDLEVDSITAQTALESLDTSGVGLDSKTAALWMGLRDRQQHLRQGLERTDEPAKSAADHLIRAKQHLSEWLEEAPERPHGLSPMRIVIGLFCLAALVASFTVHVAFLILLLPVGATSAFMWNGDDTRWRRMASQRAFEGTGVMPPRSWGEADVTRRLTDLDDEIEEQARQRERREGGADIRAMSEEEIALELVDKEMQEQALVESVKFEFESLNPHKRDVVVKMAAAHNARTVLEATRRKRAGADAKAESIRSAIYRYLKREHAIESEGRADTEILRQGLESLAQKLPQT